MVVHECKKHIEVAVKGVVPGLSNSSVKVTRHTVSGCSINILCSYRSRKMFLLKSHHRKVTLQFAFVYLENDGDFGNSVLWSDVLNQAHIECAGKKRSREL